MGIKDILMAGQQVDWKPSGQRIEKVQVMVVICQTCPVCDQYYDTVGRQHSPLHCYGHRMVQTRNWKKQM